MASNHIDVGFFGPLSYCMANESAGAECFAIGLGANNSTVYYSDIVATPAVAKALGLTNTTLEGQSGMDQLCQLLEAHKGQYTLAFVDPASTSGYGVARAAMSIAGFNPNSEMKDVGFVGSHPASLLSVLKGTSDLCTVESTMVQEYQANGNMTATNAYVVWTSDPIPNSPIAYRNNLPQSVKDEIANVILNCPPSIMEETGSTYAPVNDSTYAQIYALANALNNIST
jgi:phosphonate transport system substrate-binding protein